MPKYYILKPSLSSNNFCIFLDFRYLQWTQSIFTTNFSTDCSQKKMHCAQLQADKKEFVSKCQSFQYFLALFTRNHFFYYEKVEMAKDIHSQMWFFAMYSKTSRYTASRSTDLGDARFLIGSQNTWDTRFLAKSLEDALFFFRDTRFLTKSLEDARFLFLIYVSR